MERRAWMKLLGAAALASCQAEPAARARPAVTPTPSAPPALRVEVWHDVVCPWCRIGLRNLSVALDGWRGPAVAAVYHPFLLEPDAPPGGYDLREQLGRKYGAERVPSMFDRVTAEGASYGVRFAWDRVRRSPPTAPAHALVDWAADDRRRDLVERVHRAYFEQGRDLGDASVLASLATEAGLDAGAARAAVTDPARVAGVRRRAAEASARGISGVPHYVIGAQTLQGAQSPEAIRAAIEGALRATRNT